MARMKYWDGSAWQVVGTDAVKVAITDSAGKITATDVENALSELNTNPASIIRTYVATGTATAIAVATFKGNFTLTTGNTVNFIATANNSGAATTLNVDGTGAKSFYKPNTVTAPLLISGKAYTAYYNSGSGCFFVKASASGTADAASVLATVTFSNDYDTDIQGTMVDRSGDTSATASAISGTTLRLKASAGYRDGTNDYVTATDSNFIAANIKAGKSLFGVITGTCSDPTYSAGDVVQRSRWDTFSNLVTTSNTGYLYFGTSGNRYIVPNYTGTYRIKFTIQFPTQALGYARLYDATAGTYIGTERSGQNTTTTFSEDLTITAGHQIGIMGKTNNGSYFIAAYDYQFCAAQTPAFSLA